MDATVAKSAGTQQVTEGIYVYCIIESPQARTFGQIGMGGRGHDVYRGRAHTGVRRRAA